MAQHTWPTIQEHLRCCWPQRSFSVFCCSSWCPPSICSTSSVAAPPFICFPFPFCHKVKGREVPFLFSMGKGRKGSKCHKIQNGHGPTQMAKNTGTVAVFLAISVVFLFLLFFVVFPLYILNFVKGHLHLPFLFLPSAIR